MSKLCDVGLFCHHRLAVVGQTKDAIGLGQAEMPRGVCTGSRGKHFRSACPQQLGPMQLIYTGSQREHFRLARQPQARPSLLKGLLPALSLKLHYAQTSTCPVVVLDAQRSRVNGLRMVLKKVRSIPSSFSHDFAQNLSTHTLDHCKLLQGAEQMEDQGILGSK